ncbi:hypothetical protein ES703_44034 [subsurface metagenome]
MPEQTIIDGLKGVLDFYVYKGIAVVRSWPRSPGKKRAPAVEAQWAAFGYAASEWNNLSPEVQQAYRELASGTAYTARDWFMRAYISGIYGYPHP